MLFNVHPTDEIWSAGSILREPISKTRLWPSFVLLSSSGNLTLLSTKDMYGYEIIKKREEKSDYTLSVKQGSLYPLLHDLQEDGYLEAYWEESDSDREKIYD